jgi:hypothetical protein
MAELTNSQRRALQIVAEHGPIRPARFADLMWPDSPGHMRSYNCGPYGASIGIAMARAAGGYLGRLRVRGWVREEWHHAPWGGIEDDGWVLTKEGRQALEEDRGLPTEEEATDGSVQGGD